MIEQIIKKEGKLELVNSEKRTVTLDENPGFSEQTTNQSMYLTSKLPKKTVAELTSIDFSPNAKSVIRGIISELQHKLEGKYVILDDIITNTFKAERKVKTSLEEFNYLKEVVKNLTIDTSSLAKMTAKERELYFDMFSPIPKHKFVELEVFKGRGLLKNEVFQEINKWKGKKVYFLSYSSDYIQNTTLLESFGIQVFNLFVF